MVVAVQFFVSRAPATWLARLMQSPLTRRQFARRLAAATVGLELGSGTLRAVAPFQRSGPPRLLLSLAAYSFRSYLTDATQRDAKPEPAKRIDLFQFVDYCAEQGCAGTELTSYYFPKEVDRAYLVKLRRHCF